MRRQAEALPFRDLHRQGWRDRNLPQVHARRTGGAETGEGIDLVSGVHAAIAVDRNADRNRVGQRPHISKFGQDERIGIIARIDPVEPRLIADNLGAAIGDENLEADIQAVLDCGRRSRVGGDPECILRHCDSHAASALGLGADTIDKIAVRRLRRTRHAQRCTGEQEAGQRGSPPLAGGS